MAAVFVVQLYLPLFPGRVFGVLYWPARMVPAAAAAYALRTALAAAALLAVSAPPGSRRIGPVLAGAAGGFAAGLAGPAMNRMLFHADAVARIGMPGTRNFLLLALPLALGATAGTLIYLAASTDWSRLRKGAAGALLVLLWLFTAEAGEAYLSLFWDYGHASLAEAAQLPTAENAEESAVLVLADEDGSPGLLRREITLAAGGVSVSHMDLWQLRRYLDENGFRTVFLREALFALRKGWALNWEVEQQLDADMLTLGDAFPPDYGSFLDSMRAAPATPENAARLETMARSAYRASFPKVKQAQRMYEGFSTAYARFGDLEMSNAWLQKIRGLWPLYDDNIHIEPVSEKQDGSIRGRLLLDGKPAAAVRVGFFAIPSTSTVLDAFRFLGGSTLPDPDGSFVFEDVVPGDYYLALQAPPSLLPEGIKVSGSPGRISLNAVFKSTTLPPIKLHYFRFVSDAK